MSAMPAFQLETQVRFIDIDSFGHVNNAVFLFYFENAREHLYVQEVSPGVTFAALVGPTENFMLVAHHGIEYVAQLEQKMVPVRTDIWVAKIGRTSIEFNYALREADGSATYAIAKSGIVQVSRETGRPVPLSGEQREFLGRYTDEPLTFRSDRA